LYINVRPATRKQPSTRTGRPVPVSDVPNPKKAFFLSYFGYRTPKKSGIRIRQNRTDTGRPIRVPSEIRIVANPIFRAHLKNSMYLCITCHNRSRGAIIFSVFLIHILRTVGFVCNFNMHSFKNNNKLKFKTATVWQNYFRALASAFCHCKEGCKS